MKYRKIPVEVEAMTWDGTDAGFLVLVDWTKGGFRETRDGTYTAQVYDVLHDAWIPLRTGDMVICGVRGEFYPCRRAVFDATYEPA